MSNKNKFYPKWFEDVAAGDSYRSIFKWGAPDRFKHPNRQLYKLIKKVFDLTDGNFASPQKMGLERVSFDIPLRLNEKQIKTFEVMIGVENVKRDDYTRLRVAYGKTMLDLMRLRDRRVEHIPDLVLYPRDKEDIKQIVMFCNNQKIPIYVYGAGSSVTRGVECVKGGVSLDMGIHMKRVLQFNEINQTITVEPGMLGPKLEKVLNNAKEELNSKSKYTCGHFPQSFEFSSVGGWVVTRGAGQNSTYYGKIEEMVFSQEYITPLGTIKTREFPACATGPSIDQIMIGSEGAFGILVSVTLKVFKYMPENRKRFSFIFKNWQDAIDAIRKIMQSQFGYPSVFRLSDPEETDIAFKLYGIEGTVIDKLVSFRGYRPGERCLLLGTTEGEKDFSKLVMKKIRRICKRYHAMYTTGYVVKKWEKGRFSDPYMREDLQDFGIITDTLECAVNWQQLNDVYRGVREYCKSRPKTICMTHISHCYPQGANLYFIFIGKMDTTEEYVEYQSGILDHFQKYGAAISHHHGIGKMTAPWLESQIGKNELGVFKVLKKYFDPNNIMNPGGTLALDLPDSQKRHIQ